MLDRVHTSSGVVILYRGTSIILSVTPAGYEKTLNQLYLSIFRVFTMYFVLLLF